MCSCAFSINNPKALSLDKRRIYNVPLYKEKYLDNLYSYYLVDNFSVCFVHNAGFKLREIDACGFLAVMPHAFADHGDGDVARQRS